MNFRTLDLNLLRVFGAVMVELLAAGFAGMHVLEEPPEQPAAAAGGTGV